MPDVTRAVQHTNQPTNELAIQLTNSPPFRSNQPTHRRQDQQPNSDRRTRGRVRGARSSVGEGNGMDVQDVLELVVWIGVVLTRSAARAAEVILEWVFVAATWIALLLIGLVMS